ncbi:MAG: His/Gly/Thr/Pro-type tRNA ligase C-terminal domain-containing protein, partial [Candidatus ainarchaeum sp.]|nr:His/Gly/Thr/Pro-type tRNA ligase C-terminal domain-containing protein [Candidatus ainarchaeum sp.]
NKAKLALATEYSPEGARELEEILTLCDFEVEIDLFLARGLGYYTGPVFEIVLSEGIGTVMAGGRYDNLLGVYGQPAPAVGISVGIERLVTLITERNKTSNKAAKKTDSMVFVAPVKHESYKYALHVAAAFRAAGIHCETDLNERHIRKQFEYANALGIRFAAVVGSREEAEKKVTLHDMQSGKEESLTLDAAIAKVKGR